jgi:hypothetical protein
MCGRSGSKQRGINHFVVVRVAVNDDFAGAMCRDGALPAPDKELVRMVASGCVAAAGIRFSPMPRYFFNTRIGDELISDPDGEVLKDPDRAWEMARAMIRELLRTEGADGALLNATIEVTDDEGEIVLEFPFSEAVLLDSPDSPITKH